MRVHLNIDEELMLKLDILSKAHYTNRSAYITMVLAQHVNTQEIALNAINKTFEDVKDQLMKDK